MRPRGLSRCHGSVANSRNWCRIYFGADGGFYGGHPFWLNKSSRADSYSSDSLANCCPYCIWMYLPNSPAVAASASRFDAWSVLAHVRADHQSWTRGCSRNGSASTSSGGIPHLPTWISSPPPPPFPPFWRNLNHSQSDDVIPTPRRQRRNLARNSLQSRAIYIRSFISTDTAPTPCWFCRYW